MSRANANISTIPQTSLTRRAAVGAIAFAAASSAAVALPSSGPDAELVELGNRLAALFPEYARLLSLSNELGDRAHQLAYERTGHDPSAGPKCSKVEGDRWMAAFFAASSEVGWDDVERQQEPIFKAADELAHRIEALPAGTVAGLAAKALSAGFVQPNLWDEPFNELDWDKSRTRGLIEATLATAGVPNPFAVSV